MSRDYANRKPTASRHTRNRGAMPGWLYALAGLALGLVVAAVVYIGRPVTKGPPAIPTTEKAEAKKPVPVPPKEPTRFSFYDLLTNEVVIPGNKIEKGKESASAAATPEPGEYIIQVGSFRSRGEADAQKAKLALIGMESRVEQVTIDNKDTWYRVRIGPEADQAKVQSLVARLNENSFQSYLVKVKK